MTFIINQGFYCYKVMPFGLNTGETFQWLINKIFENQIRSTMEVYVNEMLVERLRCVDHLQHLNEAFDCLQKYKVWLSP